MSLQGHGRTAQLCTVRCSRGAKDIWPSRLRRVTFARVSAVLIAEPEAGVRGFLERHLAQDGFDVVGTDDRDAALELISRAHPDLVLLGDPAALDAFAGVPVIVIGAEQSDAIDRVSVGGTRVDLAGKEYELLVKLASEPFRVFTKEELRRAVWGFRTLGRPRTLDSHASRLRRKLQAVEPGPFVVNVWRVGYRLLD